MNSYQTRLRQLFLLMFTNIAFLTILLLLARYMMFNAFVEPELLVNRDSDLLRFWSTGFKYDLRVVAMGCTPLLLCGFFTSRTQSLWQRSKPLFYGYLALLWFLVVAISTGNYFYYQTYHNHIDLFAFGLFEDDTKAVLTNIWQDYPVIKLVAAALSALLLGYYGNRWLHGKFKFGSIWSTPKFLLAIFTTIALVFIMARGSINTFPLRRDNAQVSELAVLNKLTPNGFMAIDWAIKDHRRDARFQSVSTETGQQLQNTLGFSSLEGQTAKNGYLAKNSPHVVFTLMESFGSNLLAFDEAQKSDLLGALRPHFQRDFLFTRFLSADNGTIPSMAALLFNSPIATISSSSARDVTLGNTPFAVYKRAGYKTIFISAGSLMWHNLSNYLPKQGVDRLYDQNSLLDHYPESKSLLTDWGVPDEFAFKLAEELLAEAKEPLFITIQTVSNHPPYVVPADYQPKPIQITQKLQLHAEEGGIEQQKLLETFQYATDTFGRFVQGIKESPLANKTVLAASGDHQMRRIKAFYPQEQVLDRAVPFYLYVPPVILAQQRWKFDSQRVGSHKDIFPTLYAVSLSGQKFLALGGRNLLAEVDDQNRAFGYNVGVMIDAKGAYQLGERPVFYPWAKGSGLLLQGSSAPLTAEKAQRFAAYPKLLNWQINRAVKGIQ